MGITAKGAWKSVERHFRELGVDVNREPFTVVGIGDMSGDVFGNGMLRSRTARLVAAFDHRHVFVDPQPDPETSFAERERLFGLPASSSGRLRPDEDLERWRSVATRREVDRFAGAGKAPRCVSRRRRSPSLPATSCGRSCWHPSISFGMAESGRS